MNPRIGDHISFDAGSGITLTGTVEDRWDGSVGVVCDNSDGSIFRISPNRVLA